MKYCKLQMPLTTKIIVVFSIFLFSMSINKDSYAKIDEQTLCSMAQQHERKALDALLEVYELKRDYAVLKTLDVGSAVMENAASKIKSGLKIVDAEFAGYASTMKMTGSKCPSAVGDIRSSINLNNESTNANKIIQQLDANQRALSEQRESDARIRALEAIASQHQAPPQPIVIQQEPPLRSKARIECHEEPSIPGSKAKTICEEK